MNPYNEHAIETLKANPGRWLSVDDLLDGLLPPTMSCKESQESQNIKSYIIHKMTSLVEIGWVEHRKEGRRSYWRWIE